MAVQVLPNSKNRWGKLIAFAEARLYISTFSEARTVVEKRVEQDGYSHYRPSRMIGSSSLMRQFVNAV